jgi:hypothetical protein
VDAAEDLGYIVSRILFLLLKVMYILIANKTVVYFNLQSIILIVKEVKNCDIKING